MKRKSISDLRGLKCWPDIQETAGWGQSLYGVRVESSDVSGPL